jgi:PAS domain S-box-containing protein
MSSLDRTSPTTLMPTASEYERLRISEIRYRRLFEAAQDGVLLIDPDTRKITDANPFMTKLLGYSHDQLVGKELFEIGLLKDEQTSRDMFEELKKNGELRYEDLPLESEVGGHQEVEVVANVYDEDGRSVIQCNIRDITVRKQAEAHTKLLIAEINHRARNLLAVVQAIAQVSSKHVDQASFVAGLIERIGGLAASQDLLVANEWRGVSVRALVKSQMAHYSDLFDTRVIFVGTDVRLNASAAQGIGMALHELGTNAGKYGALSNSDGRVTISWTSDALNSLFSMSWLEQFGPPVNPPTHVGFGRTVIENMVEASVDGTTKIGYLPSGFSWDLQAPSAEVLETSARAHLRVRK